MTTCEVGRSFAARGVLYIALILAISSPIVKFHDLLETVSRGHRVANPEKRPIFDRRGPSDLPKRFPKHDFGPENSDLYWK